MVNERRRKKSERTVIVRKVVPLEKGLRPATRVEHGTKSFKIVRAVFHRLELCFRIQIVIREACAGMRFDHA